MQIIGDKRAITMLLQTRSPAIVREGSIHIFYWIIFMKIEIFICFSQNTKRLLLSPINIRKMLCNYCSVLATFLNCCTKVGSLPITFGKYCQIIARSAQQLTIALPQWSLAAVVC
jgi:hypothetical protein